MQNLTRRSMMAGMGATGLALGMSGAKSALGMKGGSSLAHLTMYSNLVERCIDECTKCYQVCHETLRYCLKMGGEHASSEHIKILTDCIAICKDSIDFMLNQSSFQEDICRLCANICKSCAESCAAFTGDTQMQFCANTCRECEKVCLKMANA